MQRSQWRFTFDGTEYTYHGYVGAPDAILLKKHAGLGVLSFWQGIIDGDPGALVGLVFIAKRHAGETVAWDDLVEAMVEDNDLIALVSSIRPVDDDAPVEAPVEQKTRAARKRQAAPVVGDEPQPEDAEEV